MSTCFSVPDVAHHCGWALKRPRAWTPEGNERDVHVTTALAAAAAAALQREHQASVQRDDATRQVEALRAALEQSERKNARAYAQLVEVVAKFQFDTGRLRERSRSSQLDTLLAGLEVEGESVELTAEDFAAFASDKYD